MSSSARDLLVRGIAAAKAKDVNEARFYLEWVLNTDADPRQRIKAWWWLSEICEDPAEKRSHLENILAYDMGHAEARRSLAILDGRLDPADVIDPSQPTRSAPSEAPQQTQTEQFTCPQCGGQMSFSPDGKVLLCPYCHHRLDPSPAAGAGDTVDEQDFFVALATAKGHSRPVGMLSFQCQGCGASFVLGPAVLSMTCPYCASAHVVESHESRQMIPPEGIIPFVLTSELAHRALQQWLKTTGVHSKAQTAAPSGIYLPVWTFDVGGEIQWRSRGVETAHARVKTVLQTNGQPIFFDDILVPACRRFANLADEFKHFRLDQLVPYESSYLADWPAETYQISAADASLKARQLAYQRARQEVSQRLTGQFLFGSGDDLSFSSAGITIDSYKLILLPAWIGYYYYRGKKSNVFINGQTGRIRGAGPRSKGRSWLGKLLGLN